jgi:SAM-dependent methyltransferase
MDIIFKQPQLYRFLQYCNESGLEKSILDCGAGGECPPLAVFANEGYKTQGIEIDDTQLEKAASFEDKHNFKLDILKGDIRKLPFDDESISFVYSYNTIFHMKKDDIMVAVQEIRRVLIPKGLCLVNFLSIFDEGYGEGEEIGEGEYIQLERGASVIHSYLKLEEGEKYFKGLNILFKESRILERIHEGKKIKQAYVDYILQKK